ncbi:MAG: hypothetical protein KGD59_04330 [Candidatus Heimdallarchaeota archaeon]|nr:hypothetical protein [Candidatus Heimdallarchaeota archaeon]MBY8993753.1 hypothetical protein [Candidatus Heimdallarchaeota archaeon]
MGASYSFGMDNNRLMKGFLRMRNSGIIFLISTIIATISGIMYSAVFANRYYSIEIALGFFEIFNVILILIASIMMYSSVTIISKNVNESNERLFKLARVLLLVFIILYSLSTIFTLILHMLNYQSVFSFGKNMIAYMLLAGFLLAFSFCFKDLQRIGYGTRLLYVPLIFLTIPSVVSLVLGCISFTDSFSNDYDTILVYSSFVNFYMVLFFFFAFLELFFVIRRMTRLIDIQYIVKSEESEPIMKKAVPAKK